MKTIPKSKICTKCHIEKPLSKFPIGCRRKGKVYYKSYCKQCDSIKQRTYYKTHKQQQREYRKNYVQNNKKEIQVKAREKYHTDSLRKLKCSLGRIRRETKCSLDELVKFYNTQLIKQNSCCAICKVHLSKLNTRFHIDHDHSKIGLKSLRSLLCSNCNSGIGNLRDSSELCYKAFQYLQSYD